MTIVMLVAGLAALIAGAEIIVNFGTRLARMLGISPLIIGLTIVSIGTSAPELAVGIDAMRRDAGSLVLGNIAGTNMVNLLLILGLSAAIRPIALQKQTFRLDLPAMVVSSILLLVLSLDGSLSTWDGALLLGVAIVYTGILLWTARREASAEGLAKHVDESADEPPRPPRRPRQVALYLGLTVVGIAVVVLGADWLVSAAVDIAGHFGVSDTLIGLTVVAIGTSLPELATTITATIRGARSIAVGNLIGSSTYNLTFILGTSLLFGPSQVGVDQQLISLDLPLMIGAALLCIPVFLSGRRIARVEGLAFVGAYAAYMTSLVALRA